MSEIELFGIIFGSLFTMFGTVLSYTLFTSKRDHRESKKRIAKLELNIIDLNKIIQEKDKQLLQAYDIYVYVKKTYQLAIKYIEKFETEKKLLYKPKK